MLSSSPFLKTHACFVVHGLSATREDVKFVTDSLVREQGHEVEIISSCANEGVLSSIFTTTDGIAEGGSRLSYEVLAFLKLHSQVNRLSFCAHSNGGNYVRYAIKQLHDELKDKIDFVNYIAFASPHCGVRSFVGGFLGLHRLVDYFLHTGILGQTGRDMVQHENLPSSGLLREMSEDAAYINAMKRFANRTIIAAKKEVIVPFASAALVESADRLEQLVGEGLTRRHYFYEHNGEGTSCWEPFIGGVDKEKERRCPTTADIKSEFPHVRAVYTQTLPSLSSSVVIADSTQGKVDDGSTTTTTTTTWWRQGSGHYSSSEYNAHSPPLQEEAAMVNRLRSEMTWTTVVVDFEEFPPCLEHWRIVVSRPYITPIGSDIPLFAARHCFIP